MMRLRARDFLRPLVVDFTVRRNTRLPTREGECSVIFPSLSWTRAECLPHKTARLLPADGLKVNPLGFDAESPGNHGSQEGGAYEQVK
jgi:hypothetical protein